MNILEMLSQVHGLETLSRLLFRLLDFIWPKDDSLAVFSGLFGTEYSDNTRFLYEKFSEEYSERLKSIWISKNILLVNQLNDSYGKFSEYQFSIRGMITLLQARFVFVMSGQNDLPGILFSKKTICIQLWHGIPIKTIMGECRSYDKRASSRIKKQIRREYAYWVSSSTIDRNSTALCTGLPLDRVIVAGYPRNDYLIEQLRSPSSRLHERLPYLRKKVILYAPTWRDKDITRFFPFADFNLEYLNSFLRSNDAYLLLRGHLVDDIVRQHGKIEREGIEGDRIIPANRDVIKDVQELLPYVDILISDYSGVWVDFLLLDRPIVLIPYDLDAYEKERGLLYDYDLITPGPRINGFQELLNTLEDYLNHPQKDSDERRIIKTIFHKYDDGLAYKRIFELMTRLSHFTPKA
ncbi:MAG: CDP-glycerol glycerophosphotransferase family protein [Candidatus Syntropharchaeales archaeon]